MKVNITARHLELTPALREYAQKRLAQVHKYTDKITNAHIVLNLEKDRHIVEVTLGVSKNKINARATSGDMYAALDLVMDKIVKQLKRRMEKIKHHKDVPSYSSVANMVWKDLEENVGQEQRSLENGLDEVRELALITQSVGEAIETITARELDFWIFRDSDEGTINIIFMKDDGRNGMLVISS